MNKPRLLTILLTLFLTINLNAQLGIKGGFAAAGALDNKLKYIHLGFDAGVTYDFTESFRAEVLVEGLYSSPVEGLKFSSYPITIGADYRFFNGIVRPFAGLNLGMMIYKDNFKDPNGFSSYQYFTIHPKAGVDIEVTEHILIDIALKYHIIFHNNGVKIFTDRILGANIGLIYVFN